MIYFSNVNNFTLTSGYIYGLLGKDIAVQERVGEVMYAQAEGHELKLACTLLGRSVPSGKVFTFVGDDAKTIFLNWPSIKEF